MTTFTRLRLNSSRYINWGTGTDSAGYGFRDLAGVIQWKNLGGAWANVGSGGGGGGAPDDASYWTRVPTGGLSNESALGSLGTGIVKSTTVTGVPSIALVADILSLFTGTCNSSTVLAGDGTCVAASGGAPSTATYITQTANGSLSAEQALGALATGILKSTTTTGVVSIAASSDVISLWTGTCNNTTVLAGNGTCVTPAGGSAAPATAPYWTRTPDAGLSNETALSALATGLLKNTTATGVPSIAVVADILALFTGTCNSATVLAGDGTCVTPSGGGGGGAPTDATYITQTANAALSAEQALSTLATGLMKVTTTTGVISAASINDILGYFGVGCTVTTVLQGNGTCGLRAPVGATYITRTPDADLSGEQALSALATGLIKNTTGTGVLTAAAVGDILGYFTGTCNASTVLTGAGTCVGLSTAFSVVTSGTNTSAAMVVGNGASLVATGTGILTATRMTSVGTVPGISGCSAGTQVGGAEAGTFVSGTTGACTVVLTFGRTAPNGWSCSPQNRTTANLIRQSASATTTCTVTGTTVSGDVISFTAVAY